MPPMHPSEFIQQLLDIVGEDGVIHTPDDLLVFEYDSAIDKSLPTAVVLPRTTEEVAAVVRLAHAQGMPITPRGAGTGISGGAIPLQHGLLVVLTRMKRIIDIDPVNRTAVVEPGVINLDISKAVSSLGLFYAPDPSSQKACSIGGNVAENSGGPHCLAYGVTTNHVLALEVVLANGDVVWLGDPTGEAPGYDLRGVFVGSEGTLGITTKIVVRLMPKPERIRTMLAVFNELEDAGDTVSDVIAHGIIPTALELMDDLATMAVEMAVHAGFPEDAGAVLLIEVEGLNETVAEQSEAIVAICNARHAREVRVAEAEADREALWLGRKSALGAMGRLAPNYYTLDGVVPRTKLPEALRRVHETGQHFGFRIPHVVHAGDGNLHPLILFDDRIAGESQRVLEVGEEIMRICVELGGTLSGEHGIGIEKQDFMQWLYSENDLAVMAKLRPAFGADEQFNPGKVFPDARHSCGEISQAIVQRALAAGAYI